MSDSKHGLAVMIGMSPKSEEGDVSMVDLAKDLCKAIEDKDYQGIADAVCALICKHDEEPEASDAEESDGKGEY